MPAEPIACRLEGERESAVLCVRWELEPGTKSRKGGGHTHFSSALTVLRPRPKWARILKAIG